MVFSKRDKEVLALIAKGFSNKEIADRLFLAEGPVKNRVSMILEKTGVRNRTEAALKAREIGVL
ncbi:LuxR C-terminal-related transcriptional regulator [Gynuella sunshinyii]|uniref:helix-turn-helix domain-containing protein n=1 Tax=Gynuella sunshinyii TaxID=1445505 RepID=UPI001B80AE38